MKTISIKKLHNKKDIESFILKNIEENCINIELEYKSDFKNAKILRSFMEVFCEMHNFSQKEVSKLVLVIDELNNNAIEYWSEHWWLNKMRIKCSKSVEWVELNIEVEDTWKWKKSKTALEMETLRAHRLKKWYKNHDSIRWRWLFLIIIRAVERLYFKNSKNWGLIVWIKKTI